MMKKQYPRVGVGVIVLDKNRRKFILGRRWGSHGEGCWCLPGGHLEFGESFEECASREVIEETGAKLSNVRLVGVSNDIVNGLHYVTIVMAAEHADGIPSEKENKFVDVGWFSVLPEPFFVAGKSVIEKFLSGMTKA